MMMMSDDFYYDLVPFLDGVEEAGANIKTVINLPPDADPDQLSRTVASEARLLKRFFLKLRQ